MKEAEFWKILEESSTGYGTENSVNEHLDSLYAILERLSDQDLMDYYRIFKLLIRSANSHELWGAAWLVPDREFGQGCGDDEFDDFRAGLIARGQDTFTKVLCNPDLVAEVPFASLLKRGESFAFASDQIYRSRHDGAMLGEIIDLGKPAPLKGKPWSEGDKAFFLENYPRCCDKWGVP